MRNCSMDESGKWYLDSLIKKPIFGAYGCDTVKTNTIINCECC